MYTVPEFLLVQPNISLLGTLTSTPFHYHYVQIFSYEKNLKIINDGSESYQFSTPDGMHRQQYFVALDEIINKLLRGIDQGN